MKRLGLRHILCPMDFSPLSSLSLATASVIARVRGAELRAMHVVPAERVSARRRLGSFEHQTVMERLRAALADVAPGDERSGAAARQGDPATESSGSTDPPRRTVKRSIAVRCLF